MKTTTARILVLLFTLVCLVITLAPAPLRAADQPIAAIEPQAGIELPPPTSDDRPFPAETQATLDRLLRQAVAEGGVPGAIAGVWLEGKGGWVQAVGQADLATGEPMQPEMAVRIASITKSFTAVTLLRLVDQGKLGLDDPLSNTLDFVPGGEQITLRMLLNHTSGIFDCDSDETFNNSLFTDPLRQWTPRQMVDLALAHPPVFAPGQGYGYSNTNYLLLGMVIEKVSGESYETQVQKQVLEPLALHTTSFPTGPDLPVPFAHGYVDETLVTSSGERRKEFTRVDMGWDWAAGALVSTLEDLKVFARALAYGWLVSLETYKQQTTWHLLFPGSDLYGDGLGLNNINGLLGHNGADPGFSSSMFCDPVRGLTVVVLYNISPAKADTGTLALQLAQAMVPGLEFPDPSQPGQFFVSATESATTPAMTRMLANPAVGSGQIAFVYTGDLWTAALDGSNPRRLTEGGWVQLNHDLVWRPAFSPDGKWIAFSGRQEGNVDVYLIPSAGGESRRLTFHPGIDLVSGFTPDGRVLFASGQEASFQTAVVRDFRLYTLSTEGGWPESLPPRFAYNGSLSPDGGTLAYTPYNDAFEIWRDYRGGLVSTIHLFNLTDWSTDPLLPQPEVLLPQPESRCNDVNPLWLDGALYFLSDREGLFNLYRFDPAKGEVQLLTHFADFPVISAAAGKGRILLEQAGRLHWFDPATGKVQAVPLQIPAEQAQPKDLTVSATGQTVINAAPAPAGDWAVLEMRGELVKASASEVQNLTLSAGVAERSPAFSADGRWLAYFSDASGQYTLHVRSADGQGASRVYPLRFSGFYSGLAWSPRGDRVAFWDQTPTIYWLDLASGALHRIATDEWCQLRTVSLCWSPDGQWIAYTLHRPTGLSQVWLYSLALDRSTTVTDGMADTSCPVFDRDGRHLYFLGSVNSGASEGGLDMSNLDMPRTDALFVATLSPSGFSPLVAAAPPASPLPADATMEVDPSTLSNRIEPLPLPAASRSFLQAGPPGVLFWLQQATPNDSPDLVSYQPASQQPKTAAAGVHFFTLSADGQKLLARTAEGWRIDPSDAAVGEGGVLLPLDGLQWTVEQPPEWRQIYWEAWRLNRDYYYDPAMHGLDWQVEGETYAQFLPDLTTRHDLDRLLAWMLSQLRVGHHFIWPPPATETGVGLLGADYTVEQGRYRFSTVYGPVPWTESLEAPLGHLGAEVKSGEYLLAVNGQTLTASDNLYSRFLGTVGQPLQITVGADPAGTITRTLTVNPIASELSLRAMSWMEANRRWVDQASDGRLGYVWLPDTATGGHYLFKRFFFAQADRQGLIIDVRFNGGGQYADYVLDLLRRIPAAWIGFRDNQPATAPGASITGPKVMLINEPAGSGGDFLPWAFREMSLGPLVGQRTWGGLVGMNTLPALVDGGSVTAPNLAIYDRQGRLVTENVGAPPDVQVAADPTALFAGRDPQLEKAVALALAALPAEQISAPTLQAGASAAPTGTPAPWVTASASSTSPPSATPSATEEPMPSPTPGLAWWVWLLIGAGSMALIVLLVVLIAGRTHKPPSA